MNLQILVVFQRASHISDKKETSCSQSVVPYSAEVLGCFDMKLSVSPVRNLIISNVDLKLTVRPESKPTS